MTNTPAKPNARHGSTIAWLVPRPLEGSGGHRTILQNIQALESAGHTCHVFVEDPRHNLTPDSPDAESRLATVREQLASFFGYQGQRIHLGFEVSDINAVNPDLTFATAWYTAAFAARPGVKGRKAYFVQDYEAYFMPVNDGYLRAEDSYNLGLPAITIGRWLTQRLARENDCPATSFEFCAAADVYRRAPDVRRENAVCAIYQPEKPRRCPNLLVQTLATLKRHHPEVKVYLYGTHDKPDLPFEHEHLGLVSVEQCAELYSRCRAGLCLSATNPSRIPFEMMACGLPVVDIHRANNLFDMPEQGVLLAKPRPDALARALALVLGDHERWETMSAFAEDFMRPRSLEHGFAQFVDAVEDLLAGRERSWKPRARALEPVYHRPDHLAFETDPLTGAPAGKPATIARGADVAKSTRDKLAAIAELDRILSSGSWKRLKTNPLYRALADTKHGPGWESVDPDEDPRVTLGRVRASKAYRLIATAKSPALMRLVGKTPQPDDPFRAAKRRPAAPAGR